MLKFKPFKNFNLSLNGHDESYVEEKTICSVCGKENTEYFNFFLNIPKEEVRTHIHSHSIFHNVAMSNEHIDDIVKEVAICQSCVSKAFRNFTRNK
jgi:thymidine kinase